MMHLFICVFCYSSIDVPFILQVENERTSLHSRLSNVQGMIGTLEDQVKSQSLQIGQANEDASQQRSTATQMRYFSICQPQSRKKMCRNS